MKWLKNLFKEKEEVVKVYDPKTKTVTEMAASQHTPNMVQAQMEGSEEIHWIDAGQLKMGERQHESFPEEVRDIIKDIKLKLDEVYPMSLEEWEDGFLRDLNPEPEIALWLHIANIYNELTTSQILIFEQKQEYFRVLATCMNSPRERVLQLADPKLIAKVEAEKVIAKFFGEEN